MVVAPTATATTLEDIGTEQDINVQISLDYAQFLESFEALALDRTFAPVLPFETSRGCWWGERAHCTFCGLNGLTMQYRSMDSRGAIARIQSLYRYTPRVRFLEAVDNIMPRSYFKEVLPYLDTPPGVTIFYEVKASLSEEEVRTLALAGVRAVQPGIEALATSTLALMRKGTSAFTNLLLLRYCRVHQVQPLWNLLVGFPGQTETVYRKYMTDIPLLAHLPPPSGIYPVRFDRFSPYFAAPEQYGLDLHPCDFYDLVYPFGKESLENLAYYFTDQNYGAEYAMHLALDLTPCASEWLRGRPAGWRPSPPLLFFKRRGETALVFDSRAGQGIEHHLSEAEALVLDALARPRRLSDLPAMCGELPAGEAEAAVDRLRERGLLFEEDGKLLSLVLPDEPPPMAYKPGFPVLDATS